MLFASFSFALMGAFVKILSPSVHFVEIVFFRNIFGLGAILLSLLKSPLINPGGRPFLLFFRGFMGTVALFAVFYNLGNMPLAKAVTYVQTAPIFIAFFSYLFLNEKLKLASWLAVFTGFLGIVMIARPEFGVIGRDDLIGILSGAGAAAAYTSIRELRRYYDNRTVVLSFMLSGTLLPLAFMIAAEYLHSSSFAFILRPFVMPQGIEWVYLGLVGATALLGQIYITKAYSASKAAIVATVGYSNIAFAALLGFMLGDRFLDAYSLMGIALIVGSGIVISSKKHGG